MLSVDVPAISRTIEECHSISMGNQRTSGQVLVILPQDENLLTITANLSNVQALSLEDMCAQAELDLRDYSQLPPGWDGYSGETFNETVIETSAKVIGFIYNHFYGTQHGLTEITPGPVADGSVDLEISDGEKIIIFNVSSDGQTLGIYREDENDSSESTSDFSWACVEQELSWLHGKVLGQTQMA